jgi:hypothetical protein
MQANLFASVRGGYIYTFKQLTTYLEQRLAALSEDQAVVTASNCNNDRTANDFKKLVTTSSLQVVYME